MQVFHTKRFVGRPIVRDSYDIGKERVHFAVDPARGDDFARYRCDHCGRMLECFAFDRFPKQFPASRFVKFKFYAVLHPNCRRCRRALRSQYAAHPLFSTLLDEHFRKLVMGAKGGAKVRGILFALEKDDVLGMFLNQGGHCSLTGLEFDWQTAGYRTKHGRNPLAPSIDRIDSRGNYALGNIQLIAQVVNIMKNDTPQDHFVAMCRRIADHNISF